MSTVNLLLVGLGFALIYVGASRLGILPDLDALASTPVDTGGVET